MISTSPNERALLGCLLAKLAALDADVLVGHNIGAYELAVLMGRLQTHKVLLLLLLRLLLTLTIWMQSGVSVEGCLDQECCVQACLVVVLRGEQVGATVAVALMQFVWCALCCRSSCGAAWVA
jgi:hypothetical protein